MNNTSKNRELLTAEQIVTEHVNQVAELRTKFFAAQTNNVILAAKTIAMAYARGNKVLICGNGGSAADAQHIAGELVNRFLFDRPPLPAIALSTDTSILTAIGNDFGFEHVFSKQVRALGKSGDILIGISTSGNSQNVIQAFNVARSMNITTMGIMGSGGKLAELSDILLAVPHPSTPVVQEVHLSIEHLLCRLIDYYLFENAKELEL